MQQAMSRASLPPPAVPPAHYLALLTEALDAGVLILDADPTIVHCNDAFGALLGRPPSAILAMGYEERIDRIRGAALSSVPGLGRPPPSDGEPRTPCLEF